MFFKKLKSKLFVNVTHFQALCKRYVSLIFSDKLSLFTLLLQAPVMLGVIYLACSKNFGYYEASVTMFVISCICVVMATLNSYREICKERDVLIRETNAGLDSTAYILSKVCIQGIICFFQALVLVVGSQFIINFNISGFVPYYHYFMMTFLILLSSTCIGLFISAILKSSDSAILPVLFIIIAQVVLSGAIIDLPSNLSFLTYFAVTRWGLGGYAQIFDFKGLADSINAGSIAAGLPPVVTVKPIFLTSYITNVLVLIGISVVCITLAILAVKKFRKRKL